MNRRKTLIGVVLAVLAVGAVVATSALVKDDNKAASAAQRKQATATLAKPALTVTRTTLTLQQWPRKLSANGTIVAWQEAVIGAEVGGLRLTEVRVNVGDQVKKGQLLARIAPETVAAELAQAKAAVDEAQAMSAEAVANANRARQLLAANFISAQQVAQQEASEQAAAARLSAAKARLQATRLRLAQTQVVAPDAGVISARTASVGSLAQVGQELFRLIRQGRLEWRAEVTAAELSRIQPGQAVTMVTASGAQVRGTVRIAAPTVDAQTRTGLVYVDLPVGSAARAGTFARGEFDLGVLQAYTLPQAALVQRDGFNYVFRLQADSKVQQTKVSVGRRVGDRVEILEGLPADSSVVASGAGFLADGDVVRVVAADDGRTGAQP